MLTYKSIREAIQTHDGQSLFCLPHLVLGEETPRTVFISNELAEIVLPPWPKTWEGRRYARLRGLLDEFTDGGFITVAENPHDKDAVAVMARVAPIELEVFDFRCLDPRPGLRAFGSFAETDIFVALTWEYRENLRNDDEWNAEIARCKSVWDTLFCGLKPFAGNNLNEYISYNVRAV